MTAITNKMGLMAPSYYLLLNSNKFPFTEQDTVITPVESTLMVGLYDSYL